MNKQYLKETIKVIILILETFALILTIIWFKNAPTSYQPFISFLSSLIFLIGTLVYYIFRKESMSSSNEHDSSKNIITDETLISAKVIEHLSDERRVAFNNLRQNITKGDEIWILGTGVTSFLNDRENLEIYLKNGARIKILMINNKLLRNTRECQGELVINHLNDPNFRDINTIGRDDLCDIDSYNFLIKKKHFDKYFNRKNYHEDIQESYQIIEKIKKKIIDENWEGELLAKHFLSFMPLSMTAIRANTNKKMIIEFILPFSEKRLMVQSSSIENKEIYDLFVEFFSNTWKNSKIVE